MKKKLFVLLLSMFAVTSFNQSNAQEALIGEVKMFAGNFAPRGWMKCEGQLISINENTVLFSIIGTYYGGDGRTTFALPDMRGRVAMGTGNGPGLTPTMEGEKKGQETTTITLQNLPSHTHAIQGEQNEPVEVMPARDPDSGMVTANHPLGSGASQTLPTGNNYPINNMQPSLSLTYIICVEGNYPSRN